jgi:hypothetical protein
MGNRLFSAHVNGGMQFAGGNQELEGLIGRPDDEINLAFGFDWSAHQRVTVSADILDRWMAYGRTRMGLRDQIFQFVQTTGGPVRSQTVQSFQSLETQYSHLMQAVVGGKVSLGRTILLSANVLLPLTNSSLTNKPALSLGAEYTF